MAVRVTLVTALLRAVALTSLLAGSAAAAANADDAKREFTIVNDTFVKDGATFRIISGSIHYHRIPPEYWEDRLRRVAGLGLNAIQMYVPWNWHELTPGTFDFGGWRNVTRFLDLAHDLGLLVLLRPGPYICAEWDFGGLPPWLMSDEAVANATVAVLGSRSSNPAADSTAAAAAAGGGAAAEGSGADSGSGSGGADGSGVMTAEDLKLMVARAAAATDIRRTLAALVAGRQAAHAAASSSSGSTAGVRLLPAAAASSSNSMSLASSAADTTGGAAGVGPGDEGAPLVLRSSDPRFLHYVDRWWAELLPRFANYTYSKGGPIVMVQVENEYGYYGEDKAYLQHLVQLAQQHLGRDVLLYTTDGSSEQVVRRGTLEGPEVYTVVDFGPGQDLEEAFGLQQQLNPPGQSPPFCSEYYTGWLTHWGEQMANTSTTAMADTLEQLLRYRDGTASVNLYMAHGGTNFGFWAGANVFGLDPQQPGYQAHITSYDYDCPVGEAGTSGQLGIGRSDKYQAVQELVLAAPKPGGSTAGTAGAAAGGGLRTGPADTQTAATPSRRLAHHLLPGGSAGPSAAKPPPVPPAPKVAAYGQVRMTDAADLLCNLDALVLELPGRRRGGASKWPLPMEQYGQAFGLILYSTPLLLGAGASCGWGQEQPCQQQQQQQQQWVNFTAHDYAKVLLGDDVIGTFWRNDPKPVPLPKQPPSPRLKQAARPTPPDPSSAQHHSQPQSQKQQQPQQPKQQAMLHILVEAMGRNNFAHGSEGLPDPKGLVSNVTILTNVTPEGQQQQQQPLPLSNWDVHHIELSYLSLQQLQWQAAAGEAHQGAAAARQQAAPRLHDTMQGAQNIVSHSAGNDAATEGKGARQQDVVQARSLHAAAAAAAAACEPVMVRAGNTAADAAAAPGRSWRMRPTAGDGPASPFRPTFYRGHFNTSLSIADGNEAATSSASSRSPSSPPADTFLSMDGWDKGYVWVNGHNLGRYWQSRGPQYTLYVPGPWLRTSGPNEVLVLELSQEPRELLVRTSQEPDFGLDKQRALAGKA